MHSRKFLPLAAIAAVLMLGTGCAKLVAAAPAEPPVFAEVWGDPELAADLPEGEFERSLQRAGETAPVMQLAHAGQLSPKDDCHRHKAAGERHWHKKGTAERGGPCIKKDGKTTYLTNHAICGKERVAFSRAKDKWNVDYKRHAEALKDCIIGLPAGGKR